MQAIDEREPKNSKGNNTVKRSFSPDSVCCPTLLSATISKGSSKPGTTVSSEQEIVSVSQSARTAGSDSIAKSSLTNGSDSTWKPSSLVGSDGIPWWEDKEGSHIPSYSNQDDSDSTSEDAAIDTSDPPEPVETEETTEQLDSSLVLLMEAVRTGEFPPTPQNMSRSSQSLGELKISVDISECDSSITGELEASRVGRKTDSTYPQQDSDSHGRGLPQNTFVPSIGSDMSCTSNYENAARPQRRSSTGSPTPREYRSSERRYSCSSARGLASIENEDRRPRRRSSVDHRADDDRRYQHRSDSYGERDRDGRYEYSSKARGERTGRAERRSSTTSRRRSLSSDRLNSSSTNRPRSSRALYDDKDAYEEDVRRTGRSERRNSTTSRRRSMSSSRIDSGSKSRSFRRVHDRTDSFEDGESRRHRSRSCHRHENLEPHSSRRRKSISRRVSDDHDDRYDESRRRSSRRRGSVGELHHDSRHRGSNDSNRNRRSRSSHRRDLGSSSHHGSSNDEYCRRSSRRSSSRHSRGDHHHRRSKSRSTRIRRDSDDDDDDHVDFESKAAVKNFIMGLLKDPHANGSHQHHQPGESRERRRSFGGLDDRRSSHRSSSRRQSGKHI